MPPRRSNQPAAKGKQKRDHEGDDDDDPVDWMVGKGDGDDGSGSDDGSNRAPRKQKPQQQQQQQQPRGGGGGGGGGGAGQKQSAGGKKGPAPAATAAAAVAVRPEATLSADKTGLRSRFFLSTADEIEREREASYAPLTHRRNNPAMPFGEWFTLVDASNSAASSAATAAAAASPSSYPTSFAIPPALPSLVPCPSPAPSPAQARSDANSNDGDGDDEERQKDQEQEGESASPQQQYQALLQRYNAWLQPIDNALTLYERNSEVWGQLHSVVASSKVVLLVADARFPALHLPLSLVHFVLVEMRRKAVVVLNKADLVTQAGVVDEWVAFLTRLLGTFLVKHGVIDSAAQLGTVVRFQVLSLQPDKWNLSGPSSASPSSASPAASSAAANNNNSLDTMRRKERKGRTSKQLGRSKAAAAAGSAADGAKSRSSRRGDNALPSVDELIGGKKNARGGSDDEHDDDGGGGEDNGSSEASSDDGRDGRGAPSFKGQSAVDQEERAAARAAAEIERLRKNASDDLQHLLDECKSLAGVTTSASSSSSAGSAAAADVLYVGMAAVPNAGKSSLVNALRGVKKVSVSATAGHTKHRQTIVLPDEGVTLIDCPGLVFPQHGLPRPLQSVIGMTQVAQSRVPACAVALLGRFLPLERIYALKKVDDTEAHWSGVEFAEALAIRRNLRVRGGRVDSNRAAVALLQDAFEGRLVLFLLPPPLELAPAIAEKSFVQRFSPL